MNIEPGKVTPFSESALVRFENLSEHRRFARFAPPLLFNADLLRIFLGIRKPEDYPMTKEMRVEVLGRTAGMLLVAGYGEESRKHELGTHILETITEYFTQPRGGQLAEIGKRMVDDFDAQQPSHPQEAPEV